MLIDASLDYARTLAKETVKLLASYFLGTSIVMPVDGRKDILLLCNDDVVLGPWMELARYNSVEEAYAVFNKVCAALEAGETYIDLTR